MRRHPGDADLALYAGGELGWMARRTLGGHVSRCPDCGDRVAEFRALRRQLKAEGETLVPEAHWARIAAEMTANIHLGLEAGACVGPVRDEPRPAPWFAIRTWAAYSGALAAIAVALLLWQPSPAVLPAAESSQVVLAASGGGIEFQGAGTSLRLQHDRSRGVTLSVSAQGAMRARFVDTETGQITINNIYAQ
jgi:hypothetical protein